MDSSENISRSEFLKRSALGLGGALVLPTFGWGTAPDTTKYYQKWRTINPLPESEKLNIALVGLGGYASGQLAPALQETKRCKLNGIVTGTPAKEARWAQQYNIDEKNIYNYETFDRIADNDDIDVIYIVLPNGMHAEYSIRAAQAGKHVICEKPMATSNADAEAIVAACAQAGVKLSVGYRLHFEPHHEEIMRIGQQQVFGDVTMTEGGFAYRAGDNPDNWRLDKELAGGGPLMDLGIYAVQGAIYTMGSLPESVTASTRTERKELFDEVEETINWEFIFPDGATAKGESSYGYSANYHRLHAEDGSAHLEPAFSYSGISGEKNGEAMTYPQVNQQTLQMDAFADCIRSGTPSRIPGEMGLRDVKMLMAIYEAAETGRRVSFDWGPDVPIDRA